MSRPENATVALINEIGLWSMLMVVPRLMWRSLMDRPFRDLPTATTERERLSRKQALPAILLYRVLKGRYGQERSLTIMHRVVKAGAVQFLSQHSATSIRQPSRPWVPTSSKTRSTDGSIVSSPRRWNLTKCIPTRFHGASPIVRSSGWSSLPAMASSRRLFVPVMPTSSPPAGLRLIFSAR